MPDAKRSAVVRAPADQEEGLKTLSEQDRQIWTEAVSFYAQGPGKQDMVFDQPLIAVTHAMRVPPNTAAKALKVDAALQATLERAAPIYRRVWWPRHQQANHDRVRDFAGSSNSMAARCATTSRAPTRLTGRRRDTWSTSAATRIGRARIQPPAI